MLVPAGPNAGFRQAFRQAYIHTQALNQAPCHLLGAPPTSMNHFQPPRGPALNRFPGGLNGASFGACAGNKVIRKAGGASRQRAGLPSGRPPLPPGGGRRQVLLSPCTGLLGAACKSWLQGSHHRVSGHRPAAAGWLEGPGMSWTGMPAARPIGPTDAHARRLLPPAAAAGGCAQAAASQGMLLGCV